MALIFCDSFDDRDDTNIEDRYEAGSTSGYARQAGRTGYGAVLSTGILDLATYLQKEFTARQTLFVGVARKPNLSTALVSIRYNGTPQIYAQWNADRTISVIRYDTGSPVTILGTSTKKTVQGAWFYVELMVKVHSSAGAYELRIDGERWLSAAGVNTSSTGDALADQVRLTYNHTGGPDDALTVIDDFYIADDDTDGGNALVTGFAGPVKIACLQPIANGDRTEWTPSAGSNFECVDSLVDEDTSYVYGDTDEVDLYSLSQLDVANPEIRGAMVHHRARKEDVFYRGIIPIVKVSGTEYSSTETEVGTAYAQVQGNYERNPATGEAWKRDEINAIQAGLQATA